MENNSISPPLRNSPIASAPDAFPWLLTLLALVGMVFVLFAVLFFGTVQYLLSHGGSVAGLNADLVHGLFGVTLQGIAEFFVIVYLAFVLPPLARTTPAGLGFVPMSPRALRYTGIAIVALFFILTVVGSLLSNAAHLKIPEVAVQIFLSLHTWMQKLQFTIFAAVVAPVWEEAVFRIFLFNAMHRWWGFWPAAITSSALFGLAHIQPPFGAPVLIGICLPLALGGLVLCWVYATTRNAWASILTHGICNFISTALLVVAPQLAK